MTARAVISQFTARHGHKRTLTALNDFQIANHETTVERNGTERQQPLLGILRQLDANFSDMHDRSSLFRSNSDTWSEDLSLRPKVGRSKCFSLGSGLHNINPRGEFSPQLCRDSESLRAIVTQRETC